MERLEKFLSNEKVCIPSDIILNIPYWQKKKQYLDEACESIEKKSQDIIKGYDELED